MLFLATENVVRILFTSSTRSVLCHATACMLPLVILGLKAQVGPGTTLDQDGPVSPTVLIIITSLSTLLLLSTVVIVVFVMRSRRRRKNVEKHTNKTSLAGKMKAPSEEHWVAHKKKTVAREESRNCNEDQDYYDPSYDYMESTYHI